MADTDQTAAPAPDAVAPGTAAFSIEKIYVKDLSLENPGAPQSFKQQEAPQIEIGLRTSGDQIEPDIYESVLTITLTAKTGDKTLFLVEASQAGIFTIRGVPPDQIQGVLAVHCPTVSSRTSARPSPTRCRAPGFRRCTSPRSISRRSTRSSSRSSRRSRRGVPN